MKTSKEKVKIYTMQNGKKELHHITEFDHENAENNKESEEMSQRYYDCPAWEKWNQIHLIRQQDKVRQIELAKFDDPIKAQLKALQQMLKGLPTEKYNQAITEMNETVSAIVAESK